MFHKKLIVTMLCLFTLLSGSQLVMAGVSGKIIGSVIEKSTGEPLPGANIYIEGTTIGAASDVNGKFVILNVAPGVYDVTASMIGYAKLTVSAVRVRIDQTTKTDFEMETEVISGAEVTVVAEKKIVKEDVATSVASFSNDEIESLPITTIDDVVELQAGVEDGLVIRGGGADEALFQLDGVTLRDPRNNQPITGISLSSVKEISIERGGFNAEYGQVRSGLINVVTNEGEKDRYSGALTFKYSAPQAKYFGISPYDPNSMWMRPFMDPEVCWVGTENGAWDIYEQRQYPQFDGWNVVSQRTLQDSDPINDLTPAAAQKIWEWQHRRRPKYDQPDYNIDAGFGGPVPFISEKLGNLRFFTAYRQDREMLLIPLSRDDYLDWNWSMHVTSNINESMKLKVTSLVGKNYNVAINATDNGFYGTQWGRNGVPSWSPTDYMRTPYMIAKVTDEQRPGRIFADSWYSTADVSHYTMAAKLTHTLSAKTYYDASVEHVARQYSTGPIADRDLTTLYEVVPGVFLNEAPFGFDPNPDTGIDGMFFGGHTATARDSSKISSTTLKFDLTTQLNYYNLVKTGFEFAYYDLNLNFGIINTFRGFNNFVKMHKFPVRLSYYIQDKLEAQGFIVNAGLRFDYTNSNTKWVNASMFDENYFSNYYDPNGDYKQIDSEGKFYVSPRLSISHPITENSKLFFNYGHFRQMPSYDEVFRVSRGGSGSVDNYGNPNLDQARTISYELGYDHSILSDYLVQVAAYYHDISDQQDFITVANVRGNVNYNQVANNSYADIRGFELTLRKSYGTFWRGFANYTYQITKTGFFGTKQIYQDPSEMRRYLQNTRNLYQQRPVPQPHARASISFLTPGDFGPQTVAGIKPLGDWILNVIADWQAGEWITWNPDQKPDILNNVQVKDYYNIDIRLNKQINFDRFKLALFVEMDNLLNTKRLSGASFDDFFDQQYYFESLHLPESDEYNNIVGEDRPGDYRKDGVEYQPIERVGNFNEIASPIPDVIYYDTGTKKYMYYKDGERLVVPQTRMDKVLEDKAYIDMPNQTSFNFLNPRQIFFGVTVNF
ncbi:TonB-dependent receptor [candidate division KSB1 bacterium]|nr:TonB-dependent receptor [candidate division KSB1 bacterium]